MPPRARAVAVVGAGAAGLVAVRELLREGHDATVFERSGRVGGTWAYDPRAGSLYSSLRTNLPRELMGFSGHGLADRVFAGDPRAFPGHREVLAFLAAFGEESGVARRVRLRAEVVRVAPLAQSQGEEEERWCVAWRGEDGVVAEEAFDAVVVCNGHCTVPLVPKPGGIDKWRGKQVHSHSYRIPEPFRDQIVVVVGLGPIGIDNAREISDVAKEVHIASRYNEHRLGKIDLYQNVWMMAKFASAKAPQQWQQTPSSTARGTATISRSWTWTSSPSTTATTASGHCTSTSSHQDTRLTSPSSGCQPRPSTSSRSSWSPGGWRACCRGGPRCRARSACWPPCGSTTAAWRRAGCPGATRTYSCLDGFVAL